ncbi:hypothetical protein TRIUR3_09567 [Triticum urartu]|uniref:Cell number regulator 8 n=1 Tax=Triticum urartu TaxID=4572 RepID=M7ZK15_TRIUA|nr:hypothetical protein TRIUR3_09567 [Triticum urartu]
MAAADEHHEEASPLLAPPANEKLPPAQDPVKGCADGVPVVMGEPVTAPAGAEPRESWDSGILSCLGRNDEFCSSDLEVLHEAGFIVMALSSLPFLFKLEKKGSFEAFTRQCGCCGGLAEDEERREHLEVACDLATHYFCHPCALCQEGRELRRRVPHPGFYGRSVVVMMPPTEQTMGRTM